MPTEDGYSLLRALRAAEREQNLSRLPAVAVTAFARSEDRERALAAGFDEYVSKPITDVDAFIATLRRTLGLSR